MAVTVRNASVESVNECAEAIGKRFSDKGLKHIYTVACGGSKAGLFPMFYLLNAEGKSFHSENITANEFALATPKACDDTSLVVAMSAAGGTPETVAAAKKATERGAFVVTISLKEECPLAEYSDFHFVQDPNLVSLSGQGLSVRLGFELLRIFDGYGKYDLAVEGFKHLDEITAQAREKSEEKAAEWAKSRKDDFICYTMASGANFNVAYSTAICHLMEMEWVHSNSIHSGEYFHGPFEVTDEHVPFLVYVSAGRTRALDERALAFLNKYSRKVEVIDAKEYGAEAFGEVAEYLEPMVVGGVGRTYLTKLAEAKKHPFTWRKYMFKEEY